MPAPVRQLPVSAWPSLRTDRGPAEYSAMQALTRELAFDPGGWTAERRARLIELFDGLAPEWHTRAGEDRLRPLRDALSRGGVRNGGFCAEIGSGIGLQTAPLQEHFDAVVSTDLSAEMLARSLRRPSVSIVRSDAFRLPLANATVDAIVAVNMYLCPAEYARVLRPGGQLVFVSVYGERTPIYLSADDVVRALEPFLDVSAAVTSGDGVGSWTVVSKGAS
ncbi:MAG: class I SAM-dependent methyltransferase [Acidimicrobiales bacterium]